MTLKQALEEATAQLRDVVERPRLEAEMLCAHHLGQPRIYLHIHEQDELKKPEAFWQLIATRATHYPLEYLTGEASFYSRIFRTCEGVLIPRPETELLIDQALELIHKHRLQHIVEIGTGSGVIAIMLALLSECQITAIDISTTALELAQQNASLHGAEDRIAFLASDLLEDFEGHCDLLVSNPPYIAKDYVLPPAVTHEPATALFGGDRGDELLCRILDQSRQKHIPWVVCEMGYDQRPSITQKLESMSCDHFGFYRDLAGLDRGFWAKL